MHKCTRRSNHARKNQLRDKGARPRRYGVPDRLCIHNHAHGADMEVDEWEKLLQYARNLVRQAVITKDREERAELLGRAFELAIDANNIETNPQLQLFENA